MCCIKDLEEVKSILTEAELALALTVYQDTCELDLTDFVGRRLKLSGGQKCREGVLVYGFHELADALAWAMRVQHALLTAKWPECIEAIDSSKTIYCCDKDRRWQKLFHGLRVSIAINKQHLLIEAATVCSSVSYAPAAVLL
jgi:hypothetical protein